MNSTYLRKNLLTLLKIDNKNNFFKKKLISKTNWNKYDLEDWIFIKNKKERIPFYFIKPDQTNVFPAVLYCHAHGGNYSIGRNELLNGRSALLSNYASFFLKRNIAVLCIEMPTFGSRQIPNESSLSKSLSWNGKNLFGKMISELLLGVNFLYAHKSINKKKIITFGFSMGATHSYWVAALDRRITASIHLCSFADLRNLIKKNTHDGHGHYMTVPGLLEKFSTAKIAGLIAPRNQLICVGLKDKFTDFKSFYISKNELETIYRKNKSEANLEFCVERKSGHIETLKFRKKVDNFLNKIL